MAVFEFSASLEYYYIPGTRTRPEKRTLTAIYIYIDRQINIHSGFILRYVRFSEKSLKIALSVNNVSPRARGFDPFRFRRFTPAPGNVPRTRYPDFFIFLFKRTDHNEKYERCTKTSAVRKLSIPKFPVYCRYKNTRDTFSNKALKRRLLYTLFEPSLLLFVLDTNNRTP